MNFKKFDVSDNQWHDVPYYQHKTATDTLTTLPAVIYPNDTSITVGIKGNTTQIGTPSPQSPVDVNGTGERTGNLWDGTYKNNWGVDVANRRVYITSDRYAIIISVNPNTDYTISRSEVGGSTYFVYGLSSAIPNDDTVFEYCDRFDYDALSQTVNSQECNYLTIFFGAALSPDIMVNTGGTSLAYEPYGYKIPISCGGTTTPVYLGEVQTERAVKKLVLTGEEANWYYYENATGTVKFFYLVIVRVVGIDLTGLPNTHGYSTHEITQQSGNTIIRIYAVSEGMETIEEWKAYLAAQYAAGTPVTIWYVLATPTTGIVNEPLMKIGDYADSLTTSIPCTAGENTLDVQTTVQPSEVSAGFSGWHPVSAVHEAEQGNNLFDYTTMATSEENSYLMPDGSIGDSNDWNISDYIPCDGTSFAIGYIGGNTPAICLYDENKQYITGKSYNTGGASSKNAVTITSQNTAKYIRFSYCKASGASYDDLSAIMLNKGGSLLPYEPYGTHWD